MPGTAATVSVVSASPDALTPVPVALQPAASKTTANPNTVLKRVRERPVHGRSCTGKATRNAPGLMILLGAQTLDVTGQRHWTLLVCRERDEGTLLLLASKGDITISVHCVLLK